MIEQETHWRAVGRTTDIPPGDPRGRSSIDLLRIARTLWRNRTIVGAIWATGVILALVLALVLPPKFTSSASFIPPNANNSSSLAAALAGQVSAMMGSSPLGGGKSPGELYAGILASRSIAGAIVKRFDLIHVYKVKKESEAEKILAGSTTIAVDPKSSIVTLNVTGKSPAMAHDIAQAYMESLRDTQGRLALSESSQRRLFFGQQLAHEKDDLEQAEVELKKTEERSGLIAPAGQTEAEIRTISETRAQITMRQVQLAALRQADTAENPAVIRLNSEIADLQGQLQRMESGKGQALATIPTSKAPEIQLEYVRKTREVKYHEALYEMLSKQFEAARLDEAHDAPVLQLLDPASYPDTKSGPRRQYILLGGIVLGLAAGCGFVLLREVFTAYRRSLAS